MKNTEYNEHKTVNMWNSETKEFETYHYGECEHCGAKVQSENGECPQYKCWIA
jgi:RNA polymerase-binding transcription factor DksA